jgi:homoserine O-acetyltransferase
MDYFDLAAEHGGYLSRAFAPAKHVRVRQFSFTSDWLFPTAENRRVTDALTSAGVDAKLTEIASDRGHDAFLLDEPKLFTEVRDFLDSISAA